MLLNKMIYKIMIPVVLFGISTGYAISKPIYIATSFPVQSILVEITGNHAEIITLVSPGSSPHTFSPKPSQVVKTQKADALFFVSEYLDGWAANLSTKKKFKMIDLLPKSFQYPFEGGDHHEHHSKTGKNESRHKSKKVIDPHFWTDPLAVKAIVPIILKKLISVNPENEKIYKENASEFVKNLGILHSDLSAKMKSFAGEPVFLFHPSFRYFLKRYGLNYMGSIETSPGKEPSAEFTMKLIKKIKESKAKALFTEPQLPSGPAKTIAEAASLKLYVLDPIGGFEKRKKYFELMQYNSDIFVKALK